MNRIILFVVYLASIGCLYGQNKSEHNIVYNPISLKESVMSIPDSVATKKQLILKRKVEEIMYLKTCVVNNRLALSVDNEYFVKNKIPLRYYELIMESLAETNAGLDRMEADRIPIGDLLKSLERTAALYRQYQKEYKSTGISIEEFNKRYHP